MSHSYPLWRGVTQGGVPPVFPFGPSPYLRRHEGYCTSHAKPPHNRTGISVVPFREDLPGCNPNWKGYGSANGVEGEVTLVTLVTLMSHGFGDFGVFPVFIQDRRWFKRAHSGTYQSAALPARSGPENKGTTLFTHHFLLNRIVPPVHP